MSDQVKLRHPASAIFLLHIALEIPVAVQGLLAPTTMPFLQMTNTTLVIIKLYSALVAGSCAAALLCFGLPEFLPGKRALAIGLCIYHLTCSTVLYYSPRIIPMSLGITAETYGITPEVLWGTLHGLVGFGLAMWWQITVQMAQMVQKVQ